MGLSGLNGEELRQHGTSPLPYRASSPFVIRRGTEQVSEGLDHPLVSVVMAAYNEERYIRSAVESILHQTYENLEMVVVDDGSTDGTPHVLATMKDSRLRVIRQSNRGQPAALNAGIHAAKGELITFLDGDDLCDSRRIEKQAEYLLTHKDLQGVGTWETVIDADGEELDRTQLPCDPKEIAAAYGVGRTGLNGMSVMAWAEVLRSLGGFREELHQANDVDMWMRATERYRFACVPMHLYCYRQHPRSSNVARKEANRFYRSLVTELRTERLATGSDRLQRGEPIEVPEFVERSGRSAYRQSMAFYQAKRSREQASVGHWKLAVGYAVQSWWSHPLSVDRMKFAGKMALGALFPPARPHLDSLGSALSNWLNWNPRRFIPADPVESLGDRSPAAPLDDAASIAPDSLTTVLVQDERSLAVLSEEWDTFLKESDTPTSFFLSSVCVLPFWRTYGTGRRLAVVAVRDSRGHLVGISPFYMESKGRGLLRHQRLALLGSPESGADYLDVLSRPGYREAVLRTSLTCLERNAVRWDGLNLNYILSGSPTIGLIHERRTGKRLWVRCRPSSQCPYATLPSTWEEFCEGLGASTRRGVKYQLNLIHRKFKEVHFERCVEEQAIPGLVQQLIAYKQARYGHRFDDDYLAWTDQAIAAFRAGYLRLLVLRLDGHPACIWFTFLFSKRVFFQACAYDPEYASYRLGKVLMAYAIQSAIEEGAVEYDMKRGTTPYKYHWANAERQTVEVNAMRSTPRGLWVYFWLYSAPGTGVRRLSRGLYQTARRSGRLLLTPIARRWPHALPQRLREKVLAASERTGSEPVVATDPA
jgi:glycosyltransferase involved in cell wall biosynthesis/GNAT superfamily N-acetyltransferase